MHGEISHVSCRQMIKRVARRLLEIRCLLLGNAAHLGQLFKP